MQRRDRGLGLELAEPVLREGGLQDPDPVGDRPGVPERAILLGQRDQGTRRGEPRRPTDVMQQHQRQQPRDLGVGDRGMEPTGQPDRLLDEVHVPRVALVEDQVEHPQHRGDIPGSIEALTCEGALGTGDPLRHGRLGHQVRRRDLVGGQPAHRPQGEGDCGGRREGRVRAQEEQLQGVVGRADRSRLGQLLELLLAPVPRVLAADPVEELPPGDGDQPALRIPRGSLRPGGDRLDQRVLHGILRRRELCSAAAEDPDDCGHQLPQQLLVHPVVGGFTP